ncbi:MAG: aminopeptidase P family protein [Treponema sp.]|nr:aminopeptidase P family protein [Treponema sp.]
MAFDLEKIFKERRDKLVSYLKEHSLAAVIFEDSEDRRDVSIRYFTGHPSDALLLLRADGYECLCPWDENLAAQRAHIGKILPYTNFDRAAEKAIPALLKDACCPAGAVVSFSPEISYSNFQKYTKALSDSPGAWKLDCSDDSVHSYVLSLRSRKDEYEIHCTRQAARITDAMTEFIWKKVQSGEFACESDVALYIEKQLRADGCERTSFDTLAAGPDRSFAIHAFPGYTGGAWGTRGLSILDFGVCYEGYASDCTITMARGPLSNEQEEILDLVEQAAAECRKLYIPGGKVLDAARKADEVFAAAGRSMPHGLGHGTGLEIHEKPFVSKRSDESILFEPGNIVTLEPGLYDPKLGGVRLENDVLITDTANEILTRSKIFRL